MKHSNIQKLDFVKLIGKEINYSLPYFHIYSVVNLLVQELITELIEIGQVQIINFGSFRIVPLAIKKIKRVNNQQVITTQPTNALRLKLSNQLVKFIKGKLGEKNANS